jgi:hypothetical protein
VHIPSRHVLTPSNAVSERLALHHKFNPTDRRRGISVERSQVARGKRRQLLTPSRVGYFHSENTRRKNHCSCPLGDRAAAGNRPCEQRTLLRRRKMKSLGDNCFEERSGTFQLGLLQGKTIRKGPIVAPESGPLGAGAPSSLVPWPFCEGAQPSRCCPGSVGRGTGRAHPLRRRRDCSRR